MRQHLGKREREARKWRLKHRKSGYAMTDCFGGVTLKLGRKKFSEAFQGNKNSLLLKKKFAGCVVDAERQPKSCAGEHP